MELLLALLLSMHSQILSQILAKPPAGGGGGTVTYVTGGSGHCSGACTGSTATYTLPQATGSGHILLVGATAVSGATAVITSVTDSGGAWATPPTGCQGNDGAVGEVSCAYKLSSTSGVTSITLNFGTADSYTWYYYEYSCSATASLDTSGNADNSTASSSPPGVGLTLSGLSDLIFQFMLAGNTPTGISAPYGQFNAPGVSTDAYATSPNTTSGTAPTWTTSTSVRSAVGALALKCQ